MKKVFLFVFILSILTFRSVFAVENIENALLKESKYIISGTFSKYDFIDASNAFDWAFTTLDGISYQLQGKKASEDNIFGWNEITIDEPEPAWYMFKLNGDIDGDGTTKFDWVLLSSNHNAKAAYKLAGISDTGEFEYSDKLNIDYTISNNFITIRPTISTNNQDNITPVYVTIYAHNEDNWYSEVNTLENYKIYRNGLVDRLKLLQSYDADFSWQSDFIILEAMERFEDSVDQSNTNYQHILKYMTEILHYSVEPHSHITQESNYADVTRAFENMDVNYNDVVGGWALFECGNTLYDTLDYIDYSSTLQIQNDGYIYGVKDSLNRWKPEILSAPSTAGHWWDGDASGVWRVGSGIQYYTPQESGLIVVGQGSPADQLNVGETHASGSRIFEKNMAYIKELILKIQNDEVPKGKIYTASISTRDRAVVTRGDIDVLDGLKQTLDILKPYVDSGQIIYADYEDVVKIWKEKYHEEPNVYHYNNFTFFKPMREQFVKYCNGDI